MKNIEIISKDEVHSNFFHEHRYIAIKNLISLNSINRLKSDLSLFFTSECMNENISMESIDSQIIKLNNDNTKRLHEI